MKPQAALWAYNQVRLGTDPNEVADYADSIEARADLIEALRARLGRGSGASLPAGRATGARAAERPAEAGQAAQAEGLDTFEGERTLQNIQRTPARSAQIDTPQFKEWFGDWQAARAAHILQGPPIATLTGNEPPAGGFAVLREWAAALFEQQGGQALSPELGPVVLDERAVRDSLAHGGANRFKRAAFAAVKDVLERGSVVHREQRAREPEGFYVSAPVNIGGVGNVVTVLVRRDPNTQRMYLHSVATKDGLLNRRVSGTDASGVERSGSSDSGAVASVIQRLLKFNGEGVSKVVDAQGRPLVVYHGIVASEAINSFAGEVGVG